MASKHPLNEVFGFRPDDMSDQARYHRDNRLCPFNNHVPQCTKDKVKNPLGVCSIDDNGVLAITCPVRFRQDWTITRDTAIELFPPETKWTALHEVDLRDRFGKAAGTADFILVSYDGNGRVLDFGALEVQAVYVSGNIREPFQSYMEHPETRCNMDWSSAEHYPRADYLSSSRKRLLPQLIYKGRILRAWGKKTVVAIHRAFHATLPAMPECEPDDAEVVWLVYDLERNPDKNSTGLVMVGEVFTRLEESIARIMSPEIGDVNGFVDILQRRLDAVLSGHPPTRKRAPRQQKTLL